LNQKIVVAISIVAIVLSSINLTTLFLPKSARGSINLPFLSMPQNLYVANVTYYYSSMENYALRYELYIVNPTNERHLFTFAFAVIGLPPTAFNATVREFQSFFFDHDSSWVIGQNAYTIWPNEAKQIIVGWRELPYAPKVRISLLDEFEGIVFSEVLDVTKHVY